MLKFVTKEEYWEIDDSGILSQLPTKFSWHLKSIQDAVVFQRIYQYKGQIIAEIGGGDSRILPVIANNNNCYNIEEFQGVGNGPKKEISFDNVKNISTMVGTFSDLLTDNYFDLIFSISVVEHVPTSELNNFFLDCHRILKSGGTMIHAIDMYIEDNPIENKGSVIRLEEYKKAFTNNLFKPLNTKDKIISKEDIKFSTAFATNPDPVMNTWNKLSPKLRDKRSRAQSCALLMIGVKQ